MIWMHSRQVAASATVGLSAVAVGALPLAAGRVSSGLVVLCGGKLANGRRGLAAAVAASRGACKLSRLVGAAPACFGLPLPA